MVLIMPKENANKKQMKCLIQEIDRRLDPEAALKELKEAAARIEKAGPTKVGSAVSKKVRDMEHERINQKSIMREIYHQRKE